MANERRNDRGKDGRTNKFVVVDGLSDPNVDGNVIATTRIRTHIKNITLLENMVAPLPGVNKYSVVIAGSQEVFKISDDDARRVINMMSNPRYS